MLPASADPAPATVEALQRGLEDCVAANPDGSFNLSIKLPNTEALTSMAKTLARLLAA